MNNKVVSIAAHPKFRDVAALRRYLSEGQEEFGTKVDMSEYYNLKDPEVQRQLQELNLWCEAMKEMPDGMLPKPKLVDLSDVIQVPIKPESNPPVMLMGRSPGKSVPTTELLNQLGRGRTFNSVTMRSDFKYMVRPEVPNDDDA